MLHLRQTVSSLLSSLLDTLFAFSDASLCHMFLDLSDYVNNQRHRLCWSPYLLIFLALADYVNNQRHCLCFSPCLPHLLGYGELS